jgi:hypothetical protein
MVFSTFKTLTFGALGILAAMSVAGSADAAEKKASGSQLPSVNKLVEYFDDVGFGLEFDPKLKAKVVTKRVDKITISLKGRPSKAVVAALQKHIKAVLPLTGLGAKTVKKRC